MPTGHREKGYRFIFYSHDHEPSHVHVSKGSRIAKLELEGGKIVERGRFRDHDLNTIQRILEANRPKIQAKWDELERRKH